MNRAVRLAPSIPTADFGPIGQQVQEAEAAGADVIHVDVMDGRFVPNITLGPIVVEGIHRATSLPLDIHLMIEEPERHIEAFAKAGAWNLTVHVEATRHLHRVVQSIKQAGVRAGVAINPATPVSMLEEILSEADLILIMSINPGWGGQRFLNGALDKMRRVRQMLDARDLPADLEVDGGINEQTAPPAVRAGADLLVAGSAIYNPTGSVAEGCHRLRAAIASGATEDLYPHLPSGIG
ncbi:MAG: ribulose-phosphate 3-epimerase [Dehalococcoidia bacterium]